MKLIMRALSTVVLFTLALPPSGLGQSLGAVLTGAQEAPGPGDEDGFGHATVTFNAERTEMTVTTSVGNIAMPTAAHIHTGAAGVPGGVLVGFADASRPFVNGAAVTVPVDPAVANQILANPSNFYVNVHNAEFPAGAVRGQLTSSGGILLGGALSGANEFPGPGDPDGGGAFLLTLDDSRTLLTYDVVVRDIGGDDAITGAHIHPGAAGTSGGVLVGLTTTEARFVEGRLRGAVTIPAETGEMIAANPEQFYVNVHTTEFAPGAVRGQLTPVSEVVLPVIGRVVGAGGELFVTDVRIFNPSYADEITILFEFFPAGMESLTGSVTTSLTVAPRGTVVLDDVGGMGFLNAEGVLGSARLTSESNFVASSRIYDDRRDSGEGTIGQFFPGLPRTAAIRRGVITHASVTSAAAAKGAFRSNLGFFNPNAAPVTIRIELRAPDGTLMSEQTVALGAMALRQQALIPQWFDLPEMDRDDLTIAFSASAPIFAYASVLDNATSDPVAVIAQEDTGEPAL